MTPVERITALRSAQPAVGPRSVRCTVGAPATTAGGTAIRRWAVVTALLLAVSASCSTSILDEETQGTTGSFEVPEIRGIVTASVLIDEAPEIPTIPVELIKISPGAIVIDLGESIRLSAEAFGPEGQLLEDIQFVWASTDPRAGNISKDGEFQAGITPGLFNDSVSATGVQNTPKGIRHASALASVTIVGDKRVPQLSAVEIIPGRPIMMAHQIHRMRAVGFDQDGLVLPGVSLVWKLNDPRLGRINDIGYLTVEGDQGIYPQVVSVTAIWEGVKVTDVTDVFVIAVPEAGESLTVHALPGRFYLDPGDQLLLRAVALNGLGELVTGTELRWSMVDARAGIIDGRGNYVAGDVPGIYSEAVRVDAMVPGESGFVRAEDYASVVIREKRSSGPGRLAAVSVVPQTVVLAPGGRATLSARAVDELGNPPKDLSISWQVVIGESGQVAALSAFTAGDIPGTYPEALRVTVEQRLGDEVITRTRTVNVIVTGTLSTAEAHPTLATVTPGKTVHFSLAGWDQNGVEIPGLVVIWSVSDESIGTIDAFGNFTAGQVAGMYEHAIRAEVIQKLPWER